MASPPVPTDRAGPVRLFLSYARADKDVVEPFAHSLEAAGFQVWWDAALEGGHHFAAEIQRELEAADAVVVVWSEASVQSNWVLDEAMHGRDRGCLIPVSFDQTPPPLGFRQIQAIRMNEVQDAAVAEAVGRAAARIMGRPIAEPGAHPRSVPSRKPRQAPEKTPHWVGFAWAIFGLVAAIIFWALRG
jgi:hypothetical protein